MNKELRAEIRVVELELRIAALERDLEQERRARHLDLGYVWGALAEDAGDQRTLLKAIIENRDYLIKLNEMFQTLAQALENESKARACVQDAYATMLQEDDDRIYELTAALKYVARVLGMSLEEVITSGKGLSNG